MWCGIICAPLLLRDQAISILKYVVFYPAFTKDLEIVQDMFNSSGTDQSTLRTKQQFGFLRSRSVDIIFIKNQIRSNIAQQE